MDGHNLTSSDNKVLVLIGLARAPLLSAAIKIAKPGKSAT